MFTGDPRPDVKNPACVAGCWSRRVHGLSRNLFLTAFLKLRRCRRNRRSRHCLYVFRSEHIHALLVRLAGRDQDAAAYTDREAGEARSDLIL